MATDKIISKIKPILLKYGVTKSDLFGSYARGDFNDQSDVDVLVDVPDGTSLFDIIYLKNDLEKTLGRKVDVVTYDSINKHVRPYIFQSIVSII
jgi:predicted nucleotidyltransferase